MRAAHFILVVTSTIALIGWPIAQTPEPMTIAAQTIAADAAAELTASITARCDECAWDIPGREAVVLRLLLDGHYSQHLPLLRTGEATYPVALGRVEAGVHTVQIEVDPATSSPELRANGIATASLSLKVASASAATALALAPFLYARANTVGRFTDVPVLMWYETSRTTRGTRYQYSVIFTNEDGGTQTDRLMATWGRTTDIEYVYSVEIAATGAIAAEDFQGPDHHVVPFRGRRDGRHPLLWVATDNNMVSDAGTTTVRYAPLPIPFNLTNTSREAIMDANPWTYAVAAKEMIREGKIARDAKPGSNTIPDPRQFVYLEACAEVGNAAIAFGVRIDESWISSDYGLPAYRIVRDGCFRGAVPLPEGMDQRQVNAIRVSAFERPVRPGEPATSTPIRLTRINTAFGLSRQYVPVPLYVEWRGVETIKPGEHFALPISRPRPQ